MKQSKAGKFRYGASKPLRHMMLQANTRKLL
jgi:hypothetical protein